MNSPIPRSSNGRPGSPMVALSLSGLAALALAGKKFEAAAGYLKALALDYPYATSGEKAAEDLPGVLFQAADYSGVIALLGGAVGGNDPADGGDGPALQNLITLAQAYDRSGDKEQALAHYHRFLRGGGYRDPRAGEAYYALGNMARLQGRNDAAAAYFKEASSKGSGSTLSPDIAELLFSSEQYAEAARQFLAIADSSKDPAEKQMASARGIVATLRLDRVKDADRLIAAFEKKFGKPKKERSEFLHERGMVYFRTKDYTKAKGLFGTSRTTRDTGVGRILPGQNRRTHGTTRRSSGTGD